MLSTVKIHFRTGKTNLVRLRLQLTLGTCSDGTIRVGDPVQTAVSVAQPLYVPLPLPRVTRDAWRELGEKCLGGVIPLLSLVYPSSESCLQKHISMTGTREVQTTYISLLCISCTIASCTPDLSTSMSSGHDESIPILGRVLFGFEPTCRRLPFSERITRMGLRVTTRSSSVRGRRPSIEVRRCRVP